MRVRSAALLVAAVVVINAFALRTELVREGDLNDSVFHLSIIESMVQRLERGEQPVDFWMPEWTLGYPVPRTYQPLAHWLNAAVYFLLGKSVSVAVLFAVARWLLIAAFPATIFGAALLLRLTPAQATGAAVIAPLISTPNLYGLEFGSYVWRGNGLFTQLLAMHLFALAIPLGIRAVRRGRGLVLAGVVVGLTYLAHFIYGYMAAASIALAALIPLSGRRVVRVAWIGGVAFGLTAFHLLPMMRDGWLINRSRWELAWKWDSFGVREVASMLLRGDLFDEGRFPVILPLAVVGAIVTWRRSRRGPILILGAFLWLLIFCGRPALGPLLNVIGLSDRVPLHRVIGGIHFFAILLAGCGLAYLVQSIARTRRYGPFIGLTVAAFVLSFAVAERYRYLRDNDRWAADNIAAYRREQPAIANMIATLRERGGRAYSGLAAGWGNRFRVGAIPVHALLSREHVPAIAFLYHAMALTSDLMVRFDEARPEHHRVFNIRSVVADREQRLPVFLTGVSRVGRFHIFNAPGKGYFDLVSVPFAIHVDRANFYDVNDAWLQSGWPAVGAHLLLDSDARSRIARLPNVEDIARTLPAAVDCGTVVSENESGGVYQGTFDVVRPCHALFRMTYHPNWRFEVDGQPRATAMLSPGFLAVPLEPGRHVLRGRYRPEGWKWALLLFVVPFIGVAAFTERRMRRPMERTVTRFVVPAGVRHVLLIVALTLPVIVPLARSAGTSGHDALEYLPRFVEFHENIRHGIVVPRWAPDLSNGRGQPLFLFNPPLFYAIAEVWHLAGLDFVPAINAALVTIVFGSAFSMFLLGRLLYGAVGGLIAATAYVYAPYFLVDLYVRAAFAEFSTFPLLPLVLFGLVRYARERRRSALVVAAVAYAGVLFAHTPTALLFSPLVIAFAAFLAWRERSWHLLTHQLAAVVMGGMLAACVWLPSVVEAKYTNAFRLKEGALSYAGHFIAAHQFFSERWGYGLSVPGDQDGMPFALGWIHIAVGVIATVWIARRKPAYRPWIFFLAAAAVSTCVLMTEDAKPLWDIAALAHYVVFPWRLLASSTVLLALLAGALTLALPPRWSAVIVIALLLANVRHATPERYLSLDPLQWTPQQIAARGVIVATFDTFESRWLLTRTAPPENPRLTVHKRTPERLAGEIAAPQAGEVELPIAYFPGWRLWVDGVPARILAPAANGLLRVRMEAGIHRVEARFGTTRIRRLANFLSFCAFLCIAALSIRRPSTVAR